MDFGPLLKAAEDKILAPLRAKAFSSEPMIVFEEDSGEEDSPPLFAIWKR